MTQERLGKSDLHSSISDSLVREATYEKF